MYIQSGHYSKMLSKNMAANKIIICILILISKSDSCHGQSDFIGNNTTDTYYHLEDFTDRQDGDKMSFCTSICRDRTVSHACLRNCISSLYGEDNLTKEDNILSIPPWLVCRENSLIVVTWISEADSHVVELLQKNGSSPYEHLDRINYTLVDSNITEFANLLPAQKYYVRVRAFNTMTGGLGKPVTSDEIWTLSSNVTLGPPQYIWVDYLEFENITNTFQASLNWRPNIEKTCNYKILLMDDYSMVGDIDSKVPHEMFSTKIDQLKYSTNYSVRIMASYGEKESKAAVYNFETQSCISVWNNTKQCPPLEPQGLTLSESLHHTEASGQRYYDLKVSWNPSEYDVDYYIVNVSTPHPLMMSANVSGSESSVMFYNVSIEQYYDAYIHAVSDGGKSGIVHLYKAIRNEKSKSQQLDWRTTLVWMILGVMLIVVLLFLFAFFFYRRHKKLVLYKRRCRYFEELEQKAPKETNTIPTCTISYEDDAFEILPDNIKLFEVLGEGAFGVVRKGWLPHINREVAVKMLKDDPSLEEVNQFRQEMDMMKSVGSHAHIVSLIGCCTRPTVPMMLVVEFCARGDLRNYLRRIWEIMTSKSNLNAMRPIHLILKTSVEEGQIKYAELMSSGSSEGNDQSPTTPNLIVNKLYELQDVIQECEERKNLDITALDLISFGRQIAMGMEFLSSNRVIHRDLAARNVLVCADKTVKIADFGLSRDVYQENMYKKTGSGKLPIKWMAIECLTHQIYTTQSDVWSFGILMWEIVTLGATPYPSVVSGDLTKLLLSGYRMERPVNCSQELYNLMLACWQFKPRERPSFTDIRQHLDSLLDSMCSNPYLSLEDTKNDDVIGAMPPESSQPPTLQTEQRVYDDSSLIKTDSERYVKPIPASSINKNFQLRPIIQITEPQGTPGYCNQPLDTTSMTLIDTDAESDSIGNIDRSNDISSNDNTDVCQLGKLFEINDNLDTSRSISPYCVEDSLITILNNEAPSVLNPPNNFTLTNGECNSVLLAQAFSINNNINKNTDNLVVPNRSRHGSIELTNVMIEKPIIDNNSDSKRSQFLCVVTQ